MREPTPEELCDALIDSITTDDGTFTEEGKVKAAGLRQRWADFKNIVHNGQLKILLLHEQQKVYAADRAEAEDD